MNPDEYRLRDKYNNMVSRIFRDTPIKKQGVFEGKHLALEPVGDKLVKSLSSKEYLLLVQ